jgi:hypothetical protein
MAVTAKQSETNGRHALNGGDGPTEARRGRGRAGAAPAAPAQLVIPKLQVVTLRFEVRGITPLLICKFDEKVKGEISEKMEGKAKNKKEAKDPEKEWNAARHIAVRSMIGGKPGWDGVHAGGIRAAIIDAGRMVDGLTMTELKQKVFVIADGYSKEGAPLVKIDGIGRMHQAMCRTTTGVAYPRYRPMYDEWGATIRLNVVGLSPENAANLLSIAGFTCGVGEWRPTSPKSKTGDCGRFEIVGGGTVA